MRVVDNLLPHNAEAFQEICEKSDDRIKQNQ